MTEPKSYLAHPPDKLKLAELAVIIGCLELYIYKRTSLLPGQDDTWKIDDTQAVRT